MFGTSGIRGPVGETVTAELAVQLGRALASEGATRVVVGRDPRESGELLNQAVTAGLRECGTDVIDLSVAATPTVARSVRWQGADAGVSITASHNPAPDNGFKLWQPTGQAYTAAQRAAIADRIEAADYEFAEWDALGTVDAWPHGPDRHVEALCEAVDLADSVSVVVDIGNGAGQVTAEALEELGCEVTTLNAQPDGGFPGRPSEPTSEHCEDLCAQVAGTDADLGLAHDGDADRLMAVSEDGTFLAGDVLLAILAREVVSSGDRVAAPLNTSLAVDDALAPLDATIERTPVGDVHVAEAAADPAVVFGGEPSGAWIWPAEIMCPDGPFAAVKLVELVANGPSLADRVADIEQYPLRRENVSVDEKTEVMARVRNGVLADYEDVQTMDGVRVDTEEGWFLIRASGTQPLIRVTAEARDANRCERLAEVALEYVTGET